MSPTPNTTLKARTTEETHRFAIGPARTGALGWPRVARFLAFWRPWLSLGAFGILMHRALFWSPVLVALVAAGCSSTNSSRDRESNPGAALQRELLTMVAVDQRVREGIRLPMTPADIARMQEVDTRHTARMKEILATHGWPGRSLVGEEGAHAAWLLVQHADDQFMADCLPLMEQAARRGEASQRDYAYLLDRVRMKQGRLQVYGTQFVSDGAGRPVLHPIEDPENVDERRRAIGLPPMADYEKKIREVYQ